MIYFRICFLWRFYTVQFAPVDKKDMEKPGKLLKKNAGEKNSKTDAKLTGKERF